jgi:hypothetical protein
VIQLGRIQDLALAQAGGQERLMATLIRIGIAFISSIISILFESSSIWFN